MSCSLGNRITLSSRPGTTKLSSKHSWSRCLRSQEPRGLLWSLFSSTRSSKAPFPEKQCLKTLTGCSRQTLKAYTYPCGPAQSAHKSHQQARSASTRERKDEPQIWSTEKGGGSGVTEPGIPNGEIKSRERSQSHTRGVSWEAAWNTGEWVRLLVRGQQRAHTGLGRYWGSGETDGNSNYRRMHSCKGCHAGSCLCLCTCCSLPPRMSFPLSAPNKPLLSRHQCSRVLPLWSFTFTASFVPPLIL